MTILVVGASGATGQLLVKQLLAKGELVKIIVRTKDRLSDELTENKQLNIIESNIVDMTTTELQSHVDGCYAVVSCLGHNLTFSGVFGHPRRLVKETVRRLSDAITVLPSDKPVKFILMNTTGNQNLLAGEKVSTSHKVVVDILRLLLPPHADNEEAARYLQSQFDSGQKMIEWVAVRPDTLTNETAVTEYDAVSSPTRSAIFDAGQTSRINVAHFMTQLLLDNCTWNKWKNQMPVIYNQ